MENETINVEVRVNKLVDADVQLYDVIDTINNLPNLRKWNYVAYILNNLELNISEINEEQREIIKKFLGQKLNKFNEDSLEVNVELD
jgi:hypothetical protein